MRRKNTLEQPGYGGLRIATGTVSNEQEVALMTGYRSRSTAPRFSSLGRQPLTGLKALEKWNRQLNKIVANVARES
jgi:hypothetical protein